MPGFRTLIIILAIVAVFLLLRRMWPRSNVRPPAAPPAQMVRCSHCGIYLPRDEAILIEGKTYCSREHYDQNAS